jgi:hypothetical protein
MPCCRSHDGPEAAATVFVCFLCDSLGITHIHTLMRPRNFHDTKYNDSSRASVSRCTRSINPIIASSLRRRVQLLPAHCRSQPGQEGDLDLARGESECLHSFSCWPPGLDLPFARVSPTPHGYSDQQPPYGPVFRLSAGQRLISRSARPRGVFAFLRAGLGNLFDLCTAYCQQTKCIMPSHLFDGKHGARGESMSCHATPWRDVGWMQRWGGCGIQQCEVRWKGNNTRLVLTAMTFLVSAAPASS